MPNRLLTHEEVTALFETQGLAPPRAAVPDAVRAACDHCWHRNEVPVQTCCWCGFVTTKAHGPYAPGGARG